MLISRRALLGGAAAACTIGRGVSGSAVLFAGCVLPESLAGFRSQRIGAESSNPHLVIIPAVESVRLAVIQPFLDRGATVLLELCLADDRIRPEPYFPYVEYSWPIKAKIREFAAASLGPAPGDRVIATYAGRPVALRRRVGRGTLVLLGSPLGPIFLSGDGDARRWLDAITSWARS